MSLPARQHTFGTDESGNQQNRKIFDVYNVYRLVLALILLISFYFQPQSSILGDINPGLFLQVVIIYTVFNIAVFFHVLLPGSDKVDNWQFVSVILIDIIFLALISYTCGGVSSGIANLMIVPVATGSLIFRSRLSTFIAAVGSILVIYCEVYLYLIIDKGIDYFFQAGVLGFLLFGVSASLQYLGGRIRQNELLAREQAENIQSLQEMNDQIIRRMHNGIMVVNRRGRILTMNDAAKRFLEMPEGDDAMPGLHPVLTEQLEAWLKDNSVRSPHFRLHENSRQLQASFTYLNPGTDPDPNILIFLEDYSLLTSRAQQLKLMSLGRLTASIAHEVRNPLGAISHASQLLNESEEISNNDQRLIEIINNHSDRVNRIIESIMDLTRSKTENMENIPLSAWMQQFVTKFSNSRNSPIDIDLSVTPDDISVLFNPGQLEQVLTNLCENGLRYSQKTTGKSHISIEIESNPDDGNPVLYVLDDGPGIPEELTQQVFEPFFTTEQSGTGLGLFICREICDANYARLNYRPAYKGKSCFQINFSDPELR